jgi:ribosomal protein S18 acetylase RimI-like enzyme
VNTQERLRDKRLQLFRRGVLEYDDFSCACLIEDMSSKGFLIACLDEFSIGQRLTLSSELFPGERFRCVVEVRHRNDYSIGATVLEIDDQSTRLRDEFMNVMMAERATASDSSAIADVHVRAWQAAYRDILPQQYLDGLSAEEREGMWRRSMQEGANVLVLRSDSGISGFIAYGSSREQAASSAEGEIWALYVDPKMWSRGVGRSLMRAAREELAAKRLKTAALWVLEENERAIRFYEALGLARAPGSRREYEIGGAVKTEVRYEWHVNPGG